jgi:hypothetical protein
MKWGRGEAAAMNRIGNITRQELEQAGVTCEILSRWREFYLLEAERNSRNRSAVGRAELMAHCLELLEC